MPKIIGLMLVVLMAIIGLPATAQETAKSRIDLVYWSSKDCPYCRQWEGSLGAEGKLRASPEFARINFYTIKNDSLKQGYEQEHFPPQLAWLWERYRDGKIKHPGRPGWQVFVDRKRVGSFQGAIRWEDTHWPKIRQLIAEAAP